MDTAFAALGRSNPFGDTTNLAVLNRNVNAIRNYITNRQNFIGTRAWNGYNGLQRLARLRDAVNAFDYYREPAIATAHQTTYRRLSTFWGQFAQVVQGQTTYDFVGAFRDITRDDLQTQATNARTYINAYLIQAITYWRNGGPGAAQHGQQTAADCLAAVQYLQQELNNLVMVNTASLM
jgi:hypothetical protein